MTASAQADGPLPSPGFVQVRGTDFVLDGQRFRFLGANVSVIHGQREREGCDAVLDAVQADGLRVIRIWALGEQPAPAEAYHSLYAFRIGEGGWIDASFEHLDRVLAAARARGLKVIVVLANRWKDYGGISTYLRWGGAEVARDAQGEPAGSALAAFFACARCQELYRQHVERVVLRVNSVSGIPYRDDPTIMAWELINEVSAVSASEEENLLLWVSQSASFVRALDSRHLISAGHVGYQTSRERRVWRAVQNLKEIDFADAHLYPQSDPRVSSAEQLPELLDDPIALSLLDVRKPLIFGEFGFERADQNEREHWTRSFAQHVEARGIAGALIWIYEPPQSPLGRHTIRVADDDTAALRLRRVLRDAAEHTRADLPSSSPPWALAALPRFGARCEERGSQTPHRAFVRQEQTYALEIDPAAFAHARFERAGVHIARGVETVWGSGEGDLEYRFRAPSFVPRSLAIEARISAELPGAGTGQDPRDGSDIEVSVDNQLIGTVRAKPDDGLGADARVELVDARLLARLFRRERTHTLRFRALSSPFAGGLCIYGAERAAVAAPEPTREQSPDAKEAGVPKLTTLRIVLERPILQPSASPERDEPPSRRRRP